MWGEALVFGVRLAQAASRPDNFALFFELVETKSGLSDKTGRQAGGLPGESRLAWGFLRLQEVDYVRLAQSLITLGFPKDVDPARASLLNSSQGFTSLATFDVQMWAFQEQGGDASVLEAHAHECGSNKSDVPSVLLQYRLPQWQPRGFSLRVMPFCAVIPAARFIRYHELGCTHFVLGSDSTKPFSEHFSAAA
jgi:hypothetical protein